MNELLERMKKNEKPFGLLDKDEKQCLKDNSKHIEIYTYPKWEGIREPNFNSFNTPYRIKPDYNPEPEIPILEGYELIPITLDECAFLSFKAGEEGDEGDELPITDAPMYPEFAGYGYKLKGMKAIQLAGNTIIWTKVDETNFVEYKMNLYEFSKRPDYVVFKEIK